MLLLQKKGLITTCDFCQNYMILIFLKHISKPLCFDLNQMKLIQNWEKYLEKSLLHSDMTFGCKRNGSWLSLLVELRPVPPAFQKGGQLLQLWGRGNCFMVTEQYKVAFLVL